MGIKKSVGSRPFCDFLEGLKKRNLLDSKRKQAINEYLEKEKKQKGGNEKIYCSKCKTEMNKKKFLEGVQYVDKTKWSYGLMANELMNFLAFFHCKNRNKNGLITLEGDALYLRILSRSTKMQSKESQKILNAAADKFYEIARRYRQKNGGGKMHEHSLELKKLTFDQLQALKKEIEIEIKTRVECRE